MTKQKPEATADPIPKNDPRQREVTIRAPAPPPSIEMVPGNIAATVTVLASATDRSIASASLTDPDKHRLCLTTS